MTSIKQIRKRYAYSVILLRQLVKTDFKLRYNDSVLGYVWSLLRPLFIFLILYLVFTVFLPVGKGVPHYPVYLLLGIVLWNYFSEVTSGSISAIVGKEDLLRKINFPKYVIIFAGSFSAFINLIINFGVIAVFMIVGHVAISWSALFIIPIIAELFLLAIGLAFLLSSLFVKFRDVSYIWEVILQAAFYATPILYALQRVPTRYAKLLILNPMAQIIQDARYVLVTPYSQTIWHLYPNKVWVWFIPVILTFTTVIVGALYFRSKSKNFAEDI